jgi:His/Glu/Gln/Arg/opine family amino acid ABC transporter permease subunit
VRIDLSFTWAALPRLLEGALITIWISCAAMALGMVLAAVLTLLRVNGTRPALMAVSFYISYVRGTPLLVQILLVFYLLPKVGLELSPIGAGISALAISSAAFTAEIVRGGLSAIPPGQIEAAVSLGMRRGVIWWRIILPQVYQLVLPPLLNEFTLVVKATPLVSVIAVIEIMRVAQQIYNENYRPLEVILGVAIIFFVINFTLGRLAAWLERRNAVRLG